MVSVGSQSHVQEGGLAQPWGGWNQGQVSLSPPGSDSLAASPCVSRPLLQGLLQEVGLTPSRSAGSLSPVFHFLPCSIETNAVSPTSC